MVSLLIRPRLENQVRCVFLCRVSRGCLIQVATEGEATKSTVGAVYEAVNELVGIGGIPGGRDIKKKPRSDL